MQGPVASVIVQVVLDIQYGLDVGDRGRVSFALLHERKMAIPGPGDSIDAIVLGLHQISPSVILNLGGSNKIEAIDSGGTTKNLATRPVKGTVIGIWLRDGVVSPIVGSVQQRMGKGVAGNDWANLIFLVGICGGNGRRV